MTESLRTELDNQIIQTVSEALIEVGKDSDSERLKLLVEIGATNQPDVSRLGIACEIAIAWIRYAQDLKNELEVRRQAGYL